MQPCERKAVPFLRVWCLAEIAAAFESDTPLVRPSTFFSPSQPHSCCKCHVYRYISATGFQGNTTTARFMQRIFSLHDPSRVAVICVARAGDDGTSERSFIKEGCREWLQFEKHDLYGRCTSFPLGIIVTFFPCTALPWVSMRGKCTSSLT
jgi:hypothetical protein